MSKKTRIHPLLIRISHWLNFAALSIMVTSGLRIYNASPLFGFKFPPILTLGGWLEGARQWHFFAMWFFAFNGLVWVVYNFSTRHGRETTIFRPGDFGGVIPMIKYYLRIRKEHPPQRKYNSLQKLAYTSTIALGAAAVLSGLAIYWPVQLQALTGLMGGYEGARLLHFFAMNSLVFFFLGHLVMVAIAGWKNFLSIFTGGRGSAFEESH